MELFAAAADGILVFPLMADGNVPPIRVIQGASTGLERVRDIAADGSGFIYAADFTRNSVSVFAPGAGGNVSPARTLVGDRTGLDHPLGITVAPDGQLFVVNNAASPSEQTITVYEPRANGNVLPVRTIRNIRVAEYLAGMAVDVKGNIFVSRVDAKVVTMLEPGATEATPFDRRIAGGAAFDIACDVDGKVYLTRGGSILVYGREFTGGQPIANIAGRATDISFEISIGVDSERVIYSLSLGRITGKCAIPDEGPSIHVFAAGADGDVDPIREIVGRQTRLGNFSQHIMSLAVFDSRTPVPLPVVPTWTYPWIPVFTRGDRTTVEINIISGKIRVRPTPVPPFPPVVDRPPQQAALLGLAIHDLASGIEDQEHRSNVQRAALDMSRSSLDRMLRATGDDSRSRGSVSSFIGSILRAVASIFDGGRPR